MAVSAFILVDVVGDHTKSCNQTMQRINGVKTVYTVCGEHDLIVKVDVDSLETLRDQVLGRIRCVEGVMKTTTCIVL